MKVLLVAINAKYIHTNPAVYSLQAYAKSRNQAYGDHIEVVEYTINHRREEILAGIYYKKPDVIAISCYIWNFPVVQELMGELHQIMPEVPLWLGGPEVSFHAKDLLVKYDSVTGVMIGEGEVTFLQLLQHYLGEGIALHEIDGLVYGDGIETRARTLTPLSDIPFLYDKLEDFNHRILYYESSRGCPFRCSYCLSAIDKTVRLRDMELVKQELQYFLDHKVQQVKFIDRTFNCNHAHAMEIWNYLLEHDNGITNFHFEIATEMMGEEELALLSKMRVGYVQLEIGVQSTNEQTIEAICRKMSVERLGHVVARIHEGGNIHCHLDLIAGLPYEGMETFAQSFNDVYAMKPEQLQLGFLKVLKGSYMEEMAEEYGIVYRSNPPYEVLYTKWLTYEEMLSLKDIEEMVELYYNTNQFAQTIAKLELLFDTPFHLYAALACFYQEKGYFTNQPSRLYRYEVLLEFVRAMGQEEGVYVEALTYDLYAREHLKSRPVFAKDLSEEKKVVRSFFQWEECNRKVLGDYNQYKAKQLSKLVHVEVFELLYDRKTYVLFDYGRRNPLTHTATIYDITTWIEGEEYV